LRAARVTVCPIAPIKIVEMMAVVAAAGIVWITATDDVIMENVGVTILVQTWNVDTANVGAHVTTSTAP
jgi:hypothetical protein